MSSPIPSIVALFMTAPDVVVMRLPLKRIDISCETPDRSLRSES